MTQLKTVGESLNALNKIHSILNNNTNIGIQQNIELASSLKIYSLDAIKAAIIQSQLNESQIHAILTEKGLKDQLLETTTAELAQITANNANAISQNAAAGASGNFKLALKGLTSTLGTTKLLLGGISIALGLAYISFSKYKQHLESIRQATQESANAYKESASSIEDYTKRYQELYKALIEAKGNEEETYNVKKQLLDLQTELNDKFGEEYGKLNLVTDAYKDQTEAIKAYNKESAQTFLNENREGIENAAKAMTKERTYNLSYTGMSSETDDGAALKEIAEKYADKGIRINADKDTGTYNIILEADVQSAYDTINAFENDIREKAKEFEDEHIFDDVLEISSTELNNAKEVIDQYADIYKQALTAEIVSDGNKSKVYNDALEAVNAYNEAVLKSEDPYNDENVLNAKKNLDEIKESIQANEEEWGKYSALTEDIFDQADTRLFDFNEKLKNDSGLKDLADDLNGLSNLDLKALNESSGGNESFDKLKASAEEYNITVDELIDSLVRLGYVQGEISSESAVLEEPQWDYSTTITQLDDIKEKLDVLDKSFAKLYDKDESIGFEDISSINEAFSEVDGIEDYIKEIQEAGQDTEKVADAFSRLTAAYLDHTGILNNVTYENKELIASMLEEMGIANAEDLVLAALGQTTEVVAIQKQFLTEKGYELANATVEEINQFIKEVSASEEVKRALAQLTLEKMDFNNNPITTSADIDNLIALANTAGASAEALVRLNEIKKAPNSARAKSILENMDWGFTKLNAADFKVSTSSSKYKPQYKGGSSTKSSIKSAQKEASKAAEEAKNEFEELVDFFEQRVKVLDNALSLLKTNLDNVTGTFAKNKLVDAELGITEEKFKNYSDALNMYTQKANEALAKLPADIAAKVKDGAVDLTTFIGDGNEEVVEAVKDYENWADKVADCKQELAELKTAIRQLELEKFNNIVEDFSNQFDIREDGKDLISKQISLLKEAGQLIGDSFFTTQIDQSKKQLELLEAEKAQLVNQMSSAIGSGRVN